MSAKRPRPNLADVAVHAGVSPSTVSRVLNNSAPVRESVRARVLASLAAVGYEPPAGRTNTTALQHSIVLLVPDILNPFFAEIARGVQEDAGLEGVLTVLLDTGEDPQREEQALRALARQPIGGIVLCGCRLSSEQLVAVHPRHRMPMVVLNRRIRHPDIPCVIVDSESATYRAARHLLDLHHTRIAYIGGPEASEASLARRRGIGTAMADAGLVLRSEWCVSGPPSASGGFLAMSALMTLPPADRPTAVVVYNDIMALGALHAARARRLRVPDDVSIIGFDDIAMAAHANPPLTTIAQPKYRMGRLAMQLLRRIIQGHPLPGDGYTLMESPLVVRESTGPAPAGDAGAPGLPAVASGSNEHDRGQ
ncbi:MAG: LacI family DNA-binding transcriptional regulator [Armatimonadota bacterium]|nr:LacI family DNA-binding transcriptional regulator [Armatimonadota bacterium]